MKDEAIRTEEKRGQEVKRPNQNLQMPKIKVGGTGTYMPPLDALTEEKGA